MIDFTETDAGNIVRTALRISSPQQIAEEALALIDAHSGLPAATKQSVQLIVERALFNPTSGDWVNAILRLPLYAPYVGIGSGDQTPLSDQDREALWVLVIQTCKSILAAHIADLHAIFDAAPTTPPENWKSQ